MILRVLTYAFSRTAFARPPESIQSGNYGSPAHPKTTWWLKQCFIYFLGLLGMKFCVFVIFQLCPWIVVVGDWALRWTEGDERVQVFFVMLFFPVVMNALQYYIIDGFIKDQKPADHEAVPAEDEDGDIEYTESDDGSDAGRRRRSETENRGGHSHVEPEESKDEVGVAVKESGAKRPNAGKTMPRSKNDESKQNEYNPETDGASSSSAGSGTRVADGRRHGDRRVGD